MKLCLFDLVPFSNDFTNLVTEGQVRTEFILIVCSAFAMKETYQNPPPPPPPLLFTMGWKEPLCSYHWTGLGMGAVMHQVRGSIRTNAGRDTRVVRVHLLQLLTTDS